jgi:hypothetical protein
MVSKHLSPLDRDEEGPLKNKEGARSPPRACTVTIRSDHQILFARSGPLPLTARDSLWSIPHTLKVLFAHQSLSSLLLYHHLAPPSHTLHTHTRSTLHSTHPHGDTSLNLDLTSPHLSSTSTNAAVLLSPPLSTSSNRLPSPLGSHLETRHDASCPSTLYRHLALSVPLNNTNSRCIDIVVSLVLSTDII